MKTTKKIQHFIRVHYYLHSLKYKNIIYIAIMIFLLMFAKELISKFTYMLIVTALYLKN
jgi:hypothetical protein